MNSPSPLPFTRDRDIAGDAVEALEDPLQLGRRDADAAVVDAHRDRARRRLVELDRDPAPRAGEYLTALSTRFQTAAFSSSASPSTNGRAAVRPARRRRSASAPSESACAPASTHSRAISREVDAASGRRGAAASRQLPGAQHLLDRVQQPVAVLQHDPVELVPLGLVELARLQRLQVQPHRRDRRLQLVGHGVDEGVVLLVAADLAHQEDGVEHEPVMIEQEEDDAEDREHALAPVEHDPADVERDGDRDQADAEDDEEDRPTAAGR